MVVVRNGYYVWALVSPGASCTMRLACKVYPDPLNYRCRRSEGVVPHIASTSSSLQAF